MSLQYRVFNKLKKFNQMFIKRSRLELSIDNPSSYIFFCFQNINCTIFFFSNSVYDRVLLSDSPKQQPSIYQYASVCKFSNGILIVIEKPCLALPVVNYYNRNFTSAYTHTFANYRVIRLHDINYSGVHMPGVQWPLQ